MQASGELVDNKIIVKKPKDAGRLYTRSHFGKSLPPLKTRSQARQGFEEDVKLGFVP